MSLKVFHSFILSLFSAKCNHYIMILHRFFHSPFASHVDLVTTFCTFLFYWLLFFSFLSEMLSTVNGITKWYFLINNAFFIVYRVASIFRLFRVIQCVLIHLHDVQTKTALAVAHCCIATYARQTRAPKRES